MTLWVVLPLAAVGAFTFAWVAGRDLRARGVPIAGGALVALLCLFAVLPGAVAWTAAARGRTYVEPRPTAARIAFAAAALALLAGGILTRH